MKAPEFISGIKSSVHKFRTNTMPKAYAKGIGKAAKAGANTFMKLPKKGKLAALGVGAVGYAAVRSYQNYLRKNP
jgi:hypothetical protein